MRDEPLDPLTRLALSCQTGVDLLAQFRRRAQFSPGFLRGDLVLLFRISRPEFDKALIDIDFDIAGGFWGVFILLLFSSLLW